MNIKSLLAIFVVALSPAAVAMEACTLVAELETGTLVHQSGSDCDVRVSPASTFKVALAVMGFETGFLIDPQHPAEPYKEEYDAYFKVWRQTVTPTTWLCDSVIWYSQLLTTRMGMEQFQAHVDMFDYGNRDLSGDRGENNGLTRAWLSSSLKISPLEQVGFFRRLVERKLPVSESTFDKVFATVEVFEGSGGWRVHGKSGTAFQLNADGKRTKVQSGWFAGWAEKNGQTYVFVRRNKEQMPEYGFAGSLAEKTLLSEIGTHIAAGA